MNKTELFKLGASIALWEKVIKIKNSFRYLVNFFFQIILNCAYELLLVVEESRMTMSMIYEAF